ncbi:MAG: zf-HC2 domain-containing protein [Planctomycetota bacterium]|nr:zf-HC2 domain-containing protein [Planctomycetota bacterium]
MKPLGMDCAEALELILDREALPDRNQLERAPDREAGTSSDGRKLAPERRLALEAHLRTCANCAAQSTGLDKALAALRAGSAAGLAVVGTGSSAADETIDLWPGLRATLAAEGRFVTPSTVRTVEAAPALQRARWRWTRVASFASAAAVLAIALPLLWKQDGRPEGGQNSPGSGSAVPVAFGPNGSNSGSTPQQGAPTNSTPELASQVAAETPAPLDPSAGPKDFTGKGGLRRALGEKRQREFATPYDATGESAGWSLASDRELR